MTLRDRAMWDREVALEVGAGEPDIRRSRAARRPRGQLVQRIRDAPGWE